MSELDRLYDIALLEAKLCQRGLLKVIYLSRDENICEYTLNMISIIGHRIDG